MNQVEKRTFLKEIKEKIDLLQEKALSASKLLAETDSHDKKTLKEASEDLNKALADQNEAIKEMFEIYDSL